MEEGLLDEASGDEYSDEEFPFHSYSYTFSLNRDYLTQDDIVQCDYCSGPLLPGEIKRAAKDRLKGLKASCNDCLEHI